MSKTLKHNKTIYDNIFDITRIIQRELNIIDVNDRISFFENVLIALARGAKLSSDMSFNDFIDQVKTALVKDKSGLYNTKVMDTVSKPKNEQDYIELINIFNSIYDYIQSKDYKAEDILGQYLYFSEQGKGKSDNGQVMTPHHIAEFMCDLLNVSENDTILDPTCGTGVFLNTALNKMTKHDKQKAAEIADKHLYGIEYDKNVYKAGITNLKLSAHDFSNIRNDDTLSDNSKSFIRNISYDKNGNLKQNHITKLLMNPPYEIQYHCISIVANTFNNVPAGTKAAVILPDRKLEKESPAKVRELLKHNRLTTIIKLPRLTFNIGVKTSIFLFNVGEHQDNKPIYTYYMKNDGLQSVKRQPRQDIYDDWRGIEKQWVDIVNNKKDDKTLNIIKPDLENLKNLSYQVPEHDTNAVERDFFKQAFDHEAFRENIDIDKLKDKLIYTLIYSDKFTNNLKDITKGMR